MVRHITTLLRGDPAGHSREEGLRGIIMELAGHTIFRSSHGRPKNGVGEADR